METNSASGRHESAKFGGLQFAQELEFCFDGLTNILGQILDAEAKNLPHPVDLVAGNIHQNARALLSLAPDQFLSEVNLIMRVLVDSALTARYLLVVGSDKREIYASQLPSSDTLRTGVRVLREQLGKRPFNDAQRRRLAVKGKSVGRKALLRFASNVTRTRYSLGIVA